MNGEEAHKIVQERMANSKCKKCKGKYRVVFMDIQMPIMDGYESTIRIRQLEESLNFDKGCIIGLTAHNTANIKSKCFTSGMDDFSNKYF